MKFYKHSHKVQKTGRIRKKKKLDKEKNPFDIKNLNISSFSS